MPPYSDREHAGEQRADDAADAVDAEAVERVVVAEHALQSGHAPVADDAGGDADDQRAGRADKARSRSDGDKAGNRAGADAEDGRLPRMIHSTNIQVKAATAVAICVTVIAIPACMPAVTAEPALKPNQPTHSSEAPMKVSTMLCWRMPCPCACRDRSRTSGRQRRR